MVVTGIITGTFNRKAYENHHYRHWLCGLSSRAHVSLKSATTSSVCDVDPRKIEILNNGGVPIHEPGLQEMHRAHARDRAHQFSTDIEASVRARRRAVHRGRHAARRGRLGGSAIRARSGAQYQAADSNGFKVIVDKSTVPVGTAQRVRAVVEEELREARARGQRKASLLGRVEPRVSEGRRGGGRLHAARPHRARHSTTTPPAAARAN